MGTWGTGLYENDTACDIAGAFEYIVRAPWDGDRLLAWLLAEHSFATDPDDPEYPDARLVLADLFRQYGIEHAPRLGIAHEMVESGRALEEWRARSDSEPDIKRRAARLQRLARKWRTPRRRPRSRRTLERPERFVLQVGD